jgi:hypothetical protein
MKMCKILLLTAFAALPASGAAVAAGPYSIVGSVESREGNLVRTEYLVKVGAHPLDRFKMVRVVKDVPAAQLRGSILLLPPLGPGYAFYEQREHDAAGTSPNGTSTSTATRCASKASRPAPARPASSIAPS